MYFCHYIIEYAQDVWHGIAWYIDEYIVTVGMRMMQTIIGATRCRPLLTKGSFDLLAEIVCAFPTT